jgi:aryl-alcohol dehydrogenase-like predicted oxidoreductase
MIEKIPFGRTGHLSSRAIFGAAALSQVSQADADRTLEVLLGYGVNHIDTAASYGEAELRIGPWMAAHRDHFFLATKSDKRTYQAALDELQQSLERLRTDVIDLWQMHFLIEEEDWQTAMGPGGALEAFVEARRQGLVRFLGVTGHGVQVAAFHARSLARFDFDAVLLPYNYAMMQNESYAAEFEALVERCQARGVAVQTIKAITRGPWGERKPHRATWYEPLEEPAAIEAAVHYVLRRPGFFLNTAGDIDLLPLVLDAAERFDPAQRPAVELADEGLRPLFT